MKLSLLLIAPILSPNFAFGRLLGGRDLVACQSCVDDTDCDDTDATTNDYCVEDTITGDKCCYNRPIPTTCSGTDVSTCTLQDACNIASCVSDVCQYADPCTGFGGPDAAGNCGKATCELDPAVVPEGYKCTVVDIGMAPGGCIREECDGDPCTVCKQQADTGCCEVAEGPEVCDDGDPCTVDTCTAVGTDPACSNDRLECTDPAGVALCPYEARECTQNQDYDCIKDKCVAGACVEVLADLGEQCAVDAVTLGTCDAAGNCEPTTTTSTTTTTTTTTTVPEPTATTACNLGGKGDSCNSDGECCSMQCNGNNANKAGSCK